MGTRISSQEKSGTRLLRHRAATQSLQDKRSTNTEAEDGTESEQVQGARSYAEVIGRERKHSAEETEDVEPERRSNIGPIFPEAHLEEDRCESNGGNNNQSHGTVEGAGLRIDDHEGECQQEQARSDYGPPASDAGTRIGQ